MWPLGFLLQSLAAIPLRYHSSSSKITSFPQIGVVRRVCCSHQQQLKHRLTKLQFLYGNSAALSAYQKRLPFSSPAPVPCPLWNFYQAPKLSHGSASEAAPHVSGSLPSKCDTCFVANSLQTCGFLQGRVSLHWPGFLEKHLSVPVLWLNEIPFREEAWVGILAYHPGYCLTCYPRCCLPTHELIVMLLSILGSGLEVVTLFCF